VVGSLGIRWDALAALVVSALAIMGSPGPATISLTAAGAAYGFRRSSRYLAGIVLGTAIVLLAVATGLTTALLALPALRPALIVASCAYILWLAYHIATAPPLRAVAKDAAAPSLAGGLALGVANPKAWVAIAAVFVSARLAGSAAADSIEKVCVLVALIVLINAAWLLAGASFAPLLRDARRARVVNVLMASLLVASTGAALALGIG
jgi:threonine/homoserine/homoserine lactone efflux protein